MTIDLVASDLPFAITHDLCDQSYVISTICLRFVYDCKLCWSHLRRNLVVSPVWLGFNMTYDLAASSTSRTPFLLFAHHSNIFRSQVGLNNLVVSPVWLGLKTHNGHSCSLHNSQEIASFYWSPSLARFHAFCVVDVSEGSTPGSLALRRLARLYTLKTNWLKQK